MGYRCGWYVVNMKIKLKELSFIRFMIDIYSKYAWLSPLRYKDVL